MPVHSVTVQVLEEGVSSSSLVKHNTVQWPLVCICYVNLKYSSSGTIIFITGYSYFY